VIQMEKPSRYKTNNNDDAIVQHRLRLASERRESQSHRVAAALDECITLVMSALRQAADTPRGMQSRKALRLLKQMSVMRMNALDGVSPCSPTRKNLEVFDAIVDTDSGMDDE
jgi:hypothetical protein